MKKKINKIEINLFKDEFTSESVYKSKRNEFIAKYKYYSEGNEKYHPGGLFSDGWYSGEKSEYKSDPVKGEAEWNNMYPNGYSEWKGKQRILTSYGQQEIIDKVNEIIDYLSKKK